MNFAIHHPVTLYRIYNLTSQRMPLNLKSLNSHAAFLFIQHDEFEVIAWIGNDCSPEDAQLTKDIGLQVMQKDFKLNQITEIPVVVEGAEINEYLKIVLDLLFISNSNIYSRKASAGERKQKIVNNSVSVGLIEHISGDEFDFTSTAFASPDANGTVVRVNFPPVDIDTIAYINVGDQWDIWIAKGVPEEQEYGALKYLENQLSSQLSTEVAFKREILSQHIHITRQGQEGVLFRRFVKIFTDFEPPGLIQDPAESKHASSRQSKKLETKPSALIPDSMTMTTDENERKVNFLGKSDLVLRNVKSESMDGEQPNKVLKQKNNRRASFEGLDKKSFDADYDRTPIQFIKFHEVVADPQYVQRPVEPIFVATKTELENIKPQMLQIFEDINIKPSQRMELINESCKNPSILIGWQVEIDEGVFSGVFIINKIKKNISRKTLYHLSAMDGDEFWIRLQRKNKKGIKFRPLRNIVDEEKAKLYVETQNRFSF